MTILIKDGRIISADGERHADILIDGEIITRIEKSLEVKADRVIDASGKLVIPGGIDVHTHLSLPVGSSVSSDDFESGTRAAAFGGTTTIIDFAQQERGRTLRQTLNARLKEAEHSVVDYGLHMVIIDLPPAHLSEIDEMIEHGVTSFKLFTAYPDRLMAADETILRVLRQTKQSGGLTIIHAEDADLIDLRVHQALLEGKIEPRYHALTRPAESEARAVKRVIELARQVEAPVYFVHISCSESIELIRQAQHIGQKVFAETCPQYLFTSLEDLDRPNFEGAKYVFTPPPREKWNQQALWKALEDNSLQVISTDHCPFNFRKEKELGRTDFTKIPNGVPGIENRVQLLYSYGVRMGKISLHRWVELISTNPAQLFGLYPRKGIIAPGSDADIVLWDPESEHTISAATHHMRVDYNLYEGWKVSGHADTVMARGEVIVEGKTWKGDPGRGKFCRRNR